MLETSPVKSDAPLRNRLLLRVGIVTALSVAISIVISVLALGAWLQFDLDRTIAGRDAMMFCFILSALVPALATPPLAWRAARLTQEAQSARDSFEELSRIDQLTKLPNRRGVDQASRTLLAEGEEGAPVSVLMIDIDRFKTINDRFGHDFGDAALRHVAQALREAAGGVTAVLGRQGGDEFIAVLPCADRNGATAFAERARRACGAHPVVWNGQQAGVTMSIGIACGDSTQSLGRLASRADAALLSAKRRGRDRADTAADVAEAATPVAA